ncbi:MAG: alpha amylase N-terminal ig-like domain-containing protein [Chloroflexi bacterium]|nr:alpha amylase N-terminal ig-like domain-containing protein [Chloroflexota bacterium]
MFRQQYSLKQLRKFFFRLVVLACLLFVFSAFDSQASPPEFQFSTICVAGNWQSPSQWDPAANPLYDDGTNGDAVGGDGIYSYTTVIPTAGNYEWKVIYDCDWGSGTTFPAGPNSWFITSMASQSVTFTFDTNTYTDDFLPASNILNINDSPGTAFTAVGDWQSEAGAAGDWINNDPATAMTDMSGGIFQFTGTIDTAGNYSGKVTVTGSWDAFGGSDGGRSKDAANINFATSAPNEQVIVTLDLNTGRVKIETQSAPPPTPDYCVAGDWQSPSQWDAVANPLHDDGTNGDAVASDGIYSATYTIATPARYSWKVIEACDWANASWPAGFGVDSWLNTTVIDQAITFTFDTNIYGDGYVPVTNILHADDNLGTSFTAVGDFNGNNTSDPLGSLSDVGGGVYEVGYDIATPGNYVGHIVVTGSTDGWGNDSRANTPAPVAFATSSTNEIVYFRLNVNTGRIQVISSTAPPPVWDSIYHSGCNSRIAADCAGAGDHAYQEEVPGLGGGITFSSVQFNGTPLPSGTADVFAYDDDSVTMYMIGDSGELTDDGQYPFIRYWIGSEQMAIMSAVGTYSGDWKGRTSNYDIFQGQIPPLRPMDVFYWLTAEHQSSSTIRSLCMSGNPDNAVGQSVGLGDCSFNDYAYLVIDDDTSGPDITGVVFNDGGDGLGNNNDQVCADVVETGTDSGDDDSSVGQVNVLYSDQLGDIIIGAGNTAAMTLSGGNTYCASGLNWSDATYYRVEAANDDMDHADDVDYTDVDTSRSAPDCEGASCDFPVGDNNIQWAEVLHDTRQPDYRSPFGAVSTGTSVQIQLRTALDDLTFAFLQVYNTPGGTHTYNMAKVGSDPTYDYYEATIPGSDTAVENQLYYKFILIDGTDEDWYVDNHSHNEFDHEDRFENGTGIMVDDGLASQYANSAFTMTVYDSNFATTIPEWAENAVIYQIMPDRFRNGNPANDEAWPAGYDVYGNAPFTHAIWNEAPVNPRDAMSPYFNYWSADFFGGDLQGIMDELDYLQSIGVTAIYLNPIFSSPSNHGYDTTDYLQINPRYGDNALFETFADEAEARGIKIIVDGVFNHTGSDSVYFDRYNRWDVNGNPVTGNDSSGACEAAGSPFASFFDLIDDGMGPCYGGRSYESWFGFDSLPILRDYIAGNSVRDFVFDVDNDGDNGFNSLPGVVQYWYGLGVDGWRFDVANEIPHDFWQQFRTQMKTNDGLIGPLYGEIWYETQPWLLGNELDSTMNYRYRKAVLGFLVDATWTDNDNNGDQTMWQLSPSEFDYVLGSIREDYPPEAWYVMMNLMGSHDTNRALFVLRQQSTDLNTAIEKLKMMAALQFTYPGAPTIYYGDEAGLGAVDWGGYSLWGAGYDALGSFQDDPYNRHTFPWNPDSEDQYNTWAGSGTYEFDSVDGPVPPMDSYRDDLRDHYAILGATRNSYPVLRTGDVVTLLADDGTDVYSYARVEGGDCAIAIFNRNAGANNVMLTNLPPACSGTFYDVLNNGASATAAGGNLTLNIPGLTSAVLVPQLANGALPIGRVEINTNDLALAETEVATITATVYDISGQTVPAGVTVNFDQLSGSGFLSSATALTDSSGIATVTYTAGIGTTRTTILAHITGANGVTYSDPATIYLNFDSDATASSVANASIGPSFNDGFNAGLDVAATKIGRGEPVLSLGQFAGDPYSSSVTPVSSFVDASISDSSNIDMVAIRAAYTDETDEANHQLYWWDGSEWTAVDTQYLDMAANEITFEATALSAPSVNDLADGVTFVIAGPMVATDLMASAVCNDPNLEVTITEGEGPFDITASAGINTPVTGVAVGVHVINGPEKWDNLTVTETTGDLESINLGQFKCRPLERPVPVSPAHRSRTTNPFPTFTWTGITDASRYRVFVFDDKNAATRTVDIRQNTSGPQTSLVLTVPLDPGRLFWRVRARVNRVWSYWSIRFTLFVDPPTMTMDGMIRVEAESAAVTNAGTWFTDQSEAASSGAYLVSTGQIGDALTLDFSGDQLGILYMEKSSAGTMMIEIDGVVWRILRTSGDGNAGAITLLTGLGAGNHTVRLYSTDGVIAVDALFVEALSEQSATATPVPTIPPDGPTEVPTEIPTETPLPQDGVPTEVPTEPVPTIPAPPNPR